MINSYSKPALLILMQVLFQFWYSHTLKAQVALELGYRTGLTYSRISGGQLNAAYFRSAAATFSERYFNVAFRSDSSLSYRVGISQQMLFIGYALASDYIGNSNLYRETFIQNGKSYWGANIGLVKRINLNIKRLTLKVNLDYQLLFSPEFPNKIMFRSIGEKKFNQKQDTLIDESSSSTSVEFNHRLRLGTSLDYRVFRKWFLGINAGFDLGLKRQNELEVNYYYTSSPARYNSRLSTRHSGFNLGASIKRVF